MRSRSGVPPGECQHRPNGARRLPFAAPGRGFTTAGMTDPRESIGRSVTSRSRQCSVQCDNLQRRKSLQPRRPWPPRSSRTRRLVYLPLPTAILVPIARVAPRACAIWRDDLLAGMPTPPPRRPARTADDRRRVRRPRRTPGVDDVAGLADDRGHRSVSQPAHMLVSRERIRSIWSSSASTSAYRTAHSFDLSTARRFSRPRSMKDLLKADAPLIWR